MEHKNILAQVMMIILLFFFCFEIGTKKTDSNEEIDMQKTCMRWTRYNRRAVVNYSLPFLFMKQ